MIYLLAGSLVGSVIWIKEEVIVFGLVFAFLAAFQRRWRTRWLWFLLGGFLWWLADLIFFWATYGDPFTITKLLAEPFMVRLRSMSWVKHRHGVTSARSWSKSIIPACSAGWRWLGASQLCAGNPSQEFALC